MLPLTELLQAVELLSTIGKPQQRAHSEQLLANGYVQAGKGRGYTQTSLNHNSIDSAFKGKRIDDGQQWEADDGAEPFISSIHSQEP